MRYEPLMDNERQHIAEMAAWHRQQVEAKHLGMLVLARWRGGRQATPGHAGWCA